MKGEIQLMFTKIKFHKLVAACRYSTTPLACQKHWVHCYRQNVKDPGPNVTGIDDEYYEYYPNADAYFPPLTPEEVFIHYLYVIAFPYFLFFGTVGNLIGMTIMKKFSHNIWSTCLYMSVLFPMDLIKLYVECGNDWYTKIHDDLENLSIYILKLSNAVCKVYSFTYSFLLHETEWLMVALSIEMLIATRYPLRIYNMCTRERGSAIALFISVILISLNLHFFWTLGLTTPADDPNINITNCLYINELSDQFRDYIWPNIDFFVKHFAPFCIILFCLIFAIPRISGTNHSPELDQRLGLYFLDIKTLHQLKKSMFVVTLIALLTIVCEMLQTGIRYAANNLFIDMNYEQMHLSLGVLMTLVYFFISHKFWIFYFFCDRFREDVRNLFKFVCRPLMKKYYTNNSSSKTCVLLDKNEDPSKSWNDNGDSSDSPCNGRSRTISFST